MIHSWYGLLVPNVAAFSKQPCCLLLTRFNHGSPTSTTSLLLFVKREPRTTSCYAFSHLTDTKTINHASLQCVHSLKKNIADNAFLVKKQYYLSTQSIRNRGRIGLYLSANEDENETDTMMMYTKTIDSEWNVAALKKEVQRLIQRAHKKIGKANQRLQTAKQKVDDLTNNPNATLDELENCPDLYAIELDVQEWQNRLGQLNQLSHELLSVKSKANNATTLPADIAQMAISLKVNDEPPPKPERGPPKKKGPRTEGPRKPYRRYYSNDNVEIRVGKKAADNDELTLRSEHRDGSDWWMHASGCPGSHVVIRYNQENIPTDIVKDAAALAARYSKCFTGSFTGNIKVSLTRCRDIKKPPGAKPGLVMLTGRIQTITVNMKEAIPRLERLEQTVEN